MPKNTFPRTTRATCRPPRLLTTEPDDTDPPPATRRETDARVPNLPPPMRGAGQPPAPRATAASISTSTSTTTTTNTGTATLDDDLDALVTGDAPPVDESSAGYAEMFALFAQGATNQQPQAVPPPAPPMRQDAAPSATSASAAKRSRRPNATPAEKMRNIEALLDANLLYQPEIADKVGVSTSVVHRASMNRKYGGSSTWRDLEKAERDEVRSLIRAGAKNSEIIRKTGILSKTLYDVRTGTIAPEDRFSVTPRRVEAVGPFLFS